MAMTVTVPCAANLACPGLHGRPATPVSFAHNSTVWPSLRTPARCSHLLCKAAARDGGVPSPAPELPAEAVDTAGDFASSLALMVLGAALISERLYGEGLVSALELDNPGVAPLLWATAGSLALAAVWPAQPPPASAVGAVRLLAGRAAYAGLAAALATELHTGAGLLALLHVDTGAQALSELEAGLTALAMLVLTVPRRSRAGRR